MHINDGDDVLVGPAVETGWRVLAVVVPTMGAGEVLNKGCKG